MAKIDRSCIAPQHQVSWLMNLTDERIAKAQAGFAASESVGQSRIARMARLHQGNHQLRIGRNLWAGVGLSEYQNADVDTFILSGYPHFEEAYRTAELLLPAIGKRSPIFQTVQQAVETATARAGAPAIGRFSSI